MATQKGYMTPNELRTIIMTKGIQASGKSTWAKEQLQRFPGKYKRINKDLLRTMLDNDIHSFENEKFILGVRDHIVERSLFRGYDVIVDDTNFSDKHWNAMCAIAKRIGNVRVQEIFFDCPIEEAVRRNALRPNPVPEGVIRKLWADKVKGQTVQVRDEYFPKEPPRLPELQEGKEKAVIVDVDGTIAINVDRDYYDLTKVLDDAPHEAVCALVKMFYEQGFKIIIVSGREDICRDDTMTWLQCHSIPYHELHMRQAGDRRKDAVVKEEIYHQQIKPRFTVWYALDDRDSVVNMWRSLGIMCMQVNFGGF
jgi:predicted kinase